MRPRIFYQTSLPFSSITARFPVHVRGPTAQAISSGRDLRTGTNFSLDRGLHTSGNSALLLDASLSSRFRCTTCRRRGHHLYNVKTQRNIFRNIQKIVRSIAGDQKDGAAQKKDASGADGSPPPITKNTSSFTGSDFLQLLFTNRDQAKPAHKQNGNSAGESRNIAKETGIEDDNPNKPELAIDGDVAVAEREIRERPKPYEGSGVDPKTREWITNIDLRPYIRACLTEIKFEKQELAERDTGLSLCTIGTGAGTGSRLRNNTATIIKNSANSYLIDAGEGLQRQLLMSRMNLGDIRTILVTHMHGDHIFGLPGLLLAMQIASVAALKDRTIEIYGPVGIFNYIAASIALSRSELQKLNVVVYELHGGTQRSARYAANRKSFPDFVNRGLVRKVLPQNTDGTWTITEPQEITTPELAEKFNSRPRGVSIKAAEIHHIPQLQCFGYTIQEPLTQPRPINAELALSLGVPPGKSFKIIKSGFPVMHKDGSRLIQPDEVLSDFNLKPRKITVLGDCCMVPPAMERLAMDSDVLVHEATLSATDTGGKKAVSGGHATAKMAALVARKARAKVLLMNHLGRRRDVYAGIKECIKEAEEVVPKTTKVQVCFDHLELLVPRNGFDFEK